MDKSLTKHHFEEAAVDILVPSATFTAGEDTNVAVELRGVSHPEISEVALAFETPYRTEDGYREVTIDRSRLATDLSIESGLIEMRETPVSIPQELPCTYGSIDVLATLEIETDRGTVACEEYLEVEPPFRLWAIFDAMFDLGFALRNTECRADHSAGGQPFIQQFDFRPKGGPFEGDLETVELFVPTGPDEDTLFVGVDREDGELNPVPRTDESKAVVESTDPGQVRDRLQSVIECNVDA